MMIPKRFLDILATTIGDTPQLRPTIIFNEGWMLRLSLDTLSRLSPIEHPLPFLPGASWFSEALLPTAFHHRTQAARLGESPTHADGAVGDIKVGRSGNAYLELAEGATQFCVIEAKMFSPLSSGVKNAPSFNQAARNVACMAEVLRRAGRSVDQIVSVGFFVLAPGEAIESGIFDPQMTREHIQATVHERVRGYGGSLDAWFDAWFMPLLKRIDLQCISWEDLLSAIDSRDNSAASELRGFYQNCLKYNRPGGRT